MKHIINIPCGRINPIIVKMIQLCYKMRLMNFIKIHKIILLSLLIFLIAFSLRVWNLNKAGHMWDEIPLLKDYAWHYIKDAKNLDFGSDYWWKGTPDHPPLVRYLRGIASLPDIRGWDNKGFPIYNYDLTYDRMLSVFLTSFTAILVFLIGARYISIYAGFAGGMIFSMMPIPLGHSQIAMLEPLGLFFFTAGMYAFFLFLEKPNKKRTVLSGIALGLALLARETHLMLLPMMIIIILIKNNCKKIQDLKLLIYKTITIFAIALFTFFCFWPMPFFHLAWEWNYFVKLRLTATTSMPEVFFGRLMLVPFLYYFAEVIITTPLIILLLSLVGLKKIDKSKNWVLYSLVLWFCFPFIMSFYPKREQGIRYIIQICIPLALLAGLGFETLISRYVKKFNFRLLLLIPLFLYQFIILIKITPYYIDYFNILVGGTKNVYEKKLFNLGYWGSGIKEAFEYLDKNAPAGASVGIATSPHHILPPLPGRKVIDPYNNNQIYDYVVVNYYIVVREGFDDSLIRKNYKIVYSVIADGAHLVEVYKRK
jgi:4-amino-4-deoxy-L-arabinose transferase-like glycosyltransferase